MASSSRRAAAGRLFMAASILAVVTGGETERRTALRPAVHTMATSTTEFTKAEQKRIAEICLGGIPVKKATSTLGPTVVIMREGYVLEHSSMSRVPYWVAERIDVDQLPTKKNERKGTWKPDPFLVPGERAELNDYSAVSDRFERGHMQPDANWLEIDRKKETYVLSNAVPQAKGFNGGRWSRLEDATREWAKFNQRVWAISGSLWHDPIEQTADGDGLVEYEIVGPSAVSVPTHLFKIVVRKVSGSGDNAKYEGLAFVMRNLRELSDEEKLKDRQDRKTIDWIEQESGYDFFSELPDDVEKQLESTLLEEEWPLDQPASGSARRRS
jgi:endonuclease G, mitochondrial